MKFFGILSLLQYVLVLLHRVLYLISQQFFQVLYLIAFPNQNRVSLANALIHLLFLFDLYLK